jgi:hypothetical protein
VIGPRGARGARGATGDRGPTGTGSGGESSVAVNLTGSATTAKGRLDGVGSTGLRVQATCRAGVFSAVSILGAETYLVHGFSHFTFADSATASVNHQGATGVTTSEPLAAGGHLIDYKNANPKAGATSSLRVIPGSDGTGALSADLLAVDGHVTVMIAVYLMVTNDPPATCRATARVIVAAPSA